MLRWFRPEMLRMFGMCISFGWLLPLYLHFRYETAVGLTAGGTVAFGDDSINFWSAARLALQGRIADVYGLEKFHEFQAGVLGGPIHLYHYSYAHVMTLPCLPLGLLSHLPAVALWLCGGCAVFALTVGSAWPSAIPKKLDVGLYSLAVPAVLVNIAAGQNGTWVASLLGFGLMAVDRRPILSGILLGSLIAKPQMALLIPVALIAGRRWATLIATGATAMTLVAVSVAVFGTKSWWAFVELVPRFLKWDLENGTGVWHLYTSVFAAVRHLPNSLPIAYAAQTIAALIALCVVARSWTLTAPQPTKNAVLIMGTFFATPYVQVYDLVVTALVPLWLLQTLLPDDPRRAPAFLAFIPLMLAPLCTPVVARLLGVGIGFLLLLPAFLFAIYDCWTTPYRDLNSQARQTSVRSE